MSVFADPGLEALTDAQVVDGMRELVRVQQQAEVRLIALVDQVSRRGLAQVHGCKSAVQFLRQLLTLSAGEAAGKVRLAAAVASRRALTGELLPPVHEQTAAAFAAGEVSGRAADIVTRTVDSLPDCVLEDAHSAVEDVLLDFARRHDPETLARHARRVAMALDHDGALRDHERAVRRRSAELRRFPDGSGMLIVYLTAEAAERVETTFDALGKPAPAEDGTRDARTPGQRRHDALLAALKLAMTSGRMPAAGGVATTLLLTMDVDDFATDSGVATTGHGYPVPVTVAKRWLDPEAKAILVLLSKTRAIAAYSDKQRLFTEQQRLAMLARDRGCSYPGCDAALGWLDAHHVTDYQQTGRTSVDDGTLVCGPHHDTFQKMGWSSQMIDGRPPLGATQLARPRPSAEAKPHQRPRLTLRQALLPVAQPEAAVGVDPPGCNRVEPATRAVATDQRACIAPPPESGSELGSAARE